MTVLKGYATLEEAHLERSRLASEGIDAQVLDESTPVSAPYALIEPGIRLAVADEDAPRAREILGLSAVLKVVPEKTHSPSWLIFVVVAAVLLVLIFIKNRNGGSQAESLTRTELDRNHDSKPDLRQEADRQGRLVAEWFDNNFDGRWDLKRKYENGILVSAEQDLDFDGLFDSTLEYQNGVLATETIRPKGEGHPLFRREFRHGVLAVTWADRDQDGGWDQRIDCDPLGRETQRTDLK
jgi:hypothetical protein